MKVNIPPTNVPDSAASGAAGTENRPGPAPERDADLFKQAMAETAPPTNAPDSAASGAAGTENRPGPALGRDADLFKQAMAETAPPTNRADAERSAAPGNRADAERLAAPGKDVTGQWAEPDGKAVIDRQGKAETASLSPPGSATGAKPVSHDAGSGDGTALTRAAGHLKEYASPDTASPRTSAEGAKATGRDNLREADEAAPESGTEAQQDLQQLVAEQMMRSQHASMQRADAGAPEAIPQQLVSDVAQRILVSAGNDGAGKEVRIQIKDTLLQDTEVIIARRHGELQVTFVTQSSSDNALLARSRDAISNSLEQALDGAVKVNVETDTEPRDGRSRGEYLREEDA